jgi:hypothetical protein
MEEKTMTADSRTVRTARMTAMLGLAVVVAFFLPFLDLGGLISASGWDIVTNEATPLGTRLLLSALPLLGLAMVGAGLAKSRASGLLCLLFGGGVLLYLAYLLFKFFLATTGLGLWITIGAAIIAVGVAAASPSRK